MARPDEDAIATFMNITGSSESIALQQLEEHGGDINEALYAHFNGGSGSNTSAAAPQYGFMDMENQTQVGSRGSLAPLLSAARSLNRYSLLDASYRRRLLSGLSASLFSGQAPPVSLPREAAELPTRFEHGNGYSGDLGWRPTRTAFSHGPEVHGNGDELGYNSSVLNSSHPYGSYMGEDMLQAPPVLRPREVADLPTRFEHGNGYSGDLGLRPTITAFSDGPEVHGNGDEVGYSSSVLNSSYPYGSYVEEDMLQAAIEASKREADGGYQDEQLGSSNGIFRTQPLPEDDEYSRALSLSLKTAEEEEELRNCLQTLGVNNSTGVENEYLRKFTAGNGRLKQGSSSLGDGVNDGEEMPVRKRSNHGSGNFPQLVGDAFPSEEWGGISSTEHDEAVTLEAVYFGDIPQRALHSSPYTPNPQSAPDKCADPNSRHVMRPPSPSLAAQRLLVEQQDDEYLASLIADREKELKAVKEAENTRSDGEPFHKALEDEEIERRLLAAKEASLPQEPPSGDENAVTLLVRMPDGSRHGRRFLKSDKLQFLFDFIDVVTALKTGTYKVVRQYPRCAFSVDESASTLNDVGLTSKHEALFLECATISDQSAGILSVGDVALY